MEETKIHPGTGEVLKRDTRELLLEYKGKLRVVNMPGWYPDGNGDSIYTQEDLKVSDKALKEMKAEVDGKMIGAKIIGTGAAGNKSVISLIENGIINRSNIMLLNSTLKDVPAGYKDIATEFSGASRGCGKERDLAKQITLKSLQDNTLNLDGFMDPQDKMVIIVTSSEGGTGCGSSTIIAKYFKEVLKVNVHMFVFTGFEEDGRGLKNTVEYFQDLDESYVVQAISNKKFLDEANGNKLKAEALANAEFVQRIKILLGLDLVDSEQNIDETDLTKLTTTPGFMMIEHGPLDKLKNVEAFNKLVLSLIDNSKSLDVEPTAKRLGVILNISEKNKDNIDYLFSVIKSRFGTPFETFTHIQKEEEPEYISIIASGLKMPIDDVKGIYTRYQEEASKVNTSKDDFFNMALNTKETSMFDMGKKEQTQEQINNSKENFFSSLNIGSNEGSKFTSVKVNKDLMEDY